VVIGIQLQQTCPDNRTAGKVERLDALVRRYLFRLRNPFALWQMRKVGYRQYHRSGRCDDLEWFVSLLFEGCTKNFMPTEQFAECLVESLDRQRSTQAQRHRDVVSRGAFFQAVQDPKPLLRKGQRKCQ